jgi:hypothetical protein
MEDPSDDRELRRRLMEAGAERLADALLDLAADSEEAADVVGRLVATREENLERFRIKIAGLQSSGRFYDWREFAGFARNLERMIEDLEAADPDPREGLELIAQFLGADGAAIESCDDSFGHVGDVFVFDGCEAFGRLAGKVGDPGFVVDVMLRLLADDEYGVRENLTKHVSSHLSRGALEALRDELIRRGDEVQDEDAEIAWRRFHRHRDRETLDSLVELIGDGRRDQVVAEEAAKILRSDGLCLSDVRFLIDEDRVEQGAELVVSRRDQLDGGNYTILVPFAEGFEASGHGVAATVVYRSLLNAVLDRGYSPAYPHGARYLRRLDALAPCVAGLEGISDHPTYLAGVRAAHGRKWRFWQRYEEAGVHGG